MRLELVLRVFGHQLDTPNTMSNCQPVSAPTFTFKLQNSPPLETSQMRQTVSA